MFLFESLPDLIVLYPFYLDKLLLKVENTSGTLANICSYVRFYVYVAMMIIVNVTVYDLAVESGPHKDLHSINHELQNLEFQTLASDDEFERSLTCTVCGVKLTYQDRAKVMWLLKRHSSENSHQVKAGSYLDAGNKALASKPKGKSNRVNC